ncbi:S8 family peptidase [Microscilla marina]|uniref:S8 family peptidase n=1 Tax=Microscilla marina TaxID=1027 RepID=UPI0005D483BE|nr:S8 family peptidase [Microscilla marina]
MNTIFLRCFIVFILTIVTQLTAQAQTSKKLLEGQAYEARTFVVKLKPTAHQVVRTQSIYSGDFQQNLAQIKGQIQPIFSPPVASKSAVAPSNQARYIQANDVSLFYRVRYQSTLTVMEAIQQVKSSGLVEYGEPSYLHTIDNTPNDPSYHKQEAYIKKVQADLAWGITKGAADVVIAIIDTGIDIDHPDLADNIYINKGEIPGNKLDDDHDGLVDNYKGWDLIGSSLASPKPDNNPDIGNNGQEHGTHVAGIAGAIMNNHFGIAGIAPQCKLMIFKVSDDTPSDTIARGYEAIKYAADQGADIINVSWGRATNLHSKFEQEMIAYATQKGALVVTSAGNNSSNSSLQAPSTYQFVLSVASVDTQDVKSPISNYGLNTDISAPGEQIISTAANGRFETKRGTSMSSAVVAGAAALVKSKKPHLTGLQIGELLRVTSDNIDHLNKPAYQQQLGAGRLNILRALTAKPSPSIRTTQVLQLDEQDQVLNIRSVFTNLLTATNDLVKIKVTGDSRFFEVNTDQITTPNKLGTLESFDNNHQPLQLKFKPYVPRHWITTLTFSYSSGSYTATEHVTVKLRSNDYLTVEKNQLKVTLSDYGRIGTDENWNHLQGEGLVYKGKRLLLSAGLIIGKSSQQVVDAVLANNSPVGFHDHFIPAQKIKQVTLPRLADFEYEGVVTDAQAGNHQLGLQIKTRYYLWNKPPYDKFMVVEHTITNTSNTPHQNLYAGWFADWDLPTLHSIYPRNQARWDEVNRMGYVRSAESDEQEFAGIMLLTPDKQATYYAMVNRRFARPEEILSDGFSSADKFKTLSSGTSHNIAPLTGASDVSHVVGAGPFSLAPNQSTTVTFAFVVGDHLEDLIAQAKEVQQLYNGKSTLAPPTQLKNNLKILPNPNNGEFLVKTGGAQIKSVAIFDIKGRLVKQQFLVNDSKLKLSLGAATQGVYFIRMYTSDGYFTKKLIIK